MRSPALKVNFGHTTGFCNYRNLDTGNTFKKTSQNICPN